MYLHIIDKYDFGSVLAAQNHIKKYVLTQKKSIKDSFSWLQYLISKVSSNILAQNYKLPLLNWDKVKKNYQIINQPCLI